jgi:uncharacterized protein (UPF0335 family)
MKLKDLWIQYKEFDQKLENVSIQRFSEQMRELGFEYSKQSGYSTYKISIDELNDIAKKRKWLHELDNDLLMKPTNDDNECMFIDQTDKAEYIRAEDHKIVLEKLNKVEQSNKDMINDLTDMQSYISQLESYIYKMESIDDEQSNEIDDVDADEDVVDEDTDETDVDVDEPSNECMFKKAKQSNEIDDVVVDEDVDEDVVDEDVDFIEIGNNVYLNKKTNKTYEIAADDDLNDDLNEDLF